MRQVPFGLGLGAVLALVLTPAPAAWQTSSDPFAFLAPTVSVTAEERKRLEAGEPVIRMMDGASGELVVFGATRIRADGDRLAAWIRRVEDLKRSDRVPAIERFSESPRIEDLSALSLDPTELADLRACRAGRCELKLSSDEIARVQSAVGAGRASSDAALQLLMREIVLGRVRRYAAGTPGAAFDLGPMLSRSRFLTSAAPALTALLTQGPQAAPSDVESFLYWSLEDFGAKPVVGATHVGITRPSAAHLPEVIVASRQVFATHYFDGALNVTMVTRGRDDGPRYLIFVNRSAVDALGGLLGGIKRFVVERRLRGDGQELLEGLRDRLESGAPGD